MMKFITSLFILVGIVMVTIAVNNRLMDQGYDQKKVMIRELQEENARLISENKNLKSVNENLVLEIATKELVCEENSNTESATALIEKLRSMENDILNYKKNCNIKEDEITVEHVIENKGKEKQGLTVKKSNIEVSSDN